jgi:phospholipid-binding lipoprotein MlaA
MNHFAASLRTLVLVATVSVLAGCATVPPGPAGTQAAAPADPWENWNRKVYSFNDAIDSAVVKPVATAYRDVVPQLVRTGVSNFFGNIGDVWSAANHVLQGKVGTGLEMGFRVLTNTLMGLGGVLDPATEFGMQRRSEDFGQTLGVWGLGTGPYVMLPLLGPSTVRDSFGLLADRQFSPSSLATTDAATAAVVTLEVVNLRASLLDASKLMDQVALDRYSFLRDAYLQRRRDAVYDGAPPFEDEFADEPPTPAGGKTEPAAKPAVQTPAAAAPAAAAASAPKPAPKK